MESSTSSRGDGWLHKALAKLKAKSGSSRPKDSTPGATLTSTSNNVNQELASRKRYSFPLLKDPSDSIRLLRLDHFDRNANVPLSGTLSAFKLVEAPEYSALSYTWGSPVPDTFNEPFDPETPFTQASALRSSDINWKDRLWPATINGQIVHLTRNLRDALYRLAPANVGAWLWIDALCIDQDNLTELAAQVVLMTQIYKTAAKVTVWLGEEDETVEQAHNLQKALYPCAATRMDTVLREETNPVDPEFWRTLGAGPFPTQWWWSWIQFYRRNWFQRVWTMQEFALATNSNIVCGSYSFDYWECLEVETYFRDSGLRTYVLALLNRHIPQTYLSVNSLKELKELCNNPQYHARPQTLSWWFVCGARGDSAWLLHLILYLHTKSTTDPRDRIFGSLGMLKEMRTLRQQVRAEYIPANQQMSVEDPVELSNELKVDYTIHENDVAKSMAIWIIKNTMCLPYLSLITYRPLSEILSPDGFPSWVAVLEPSHDRLMALGYRTHGLQPNYDASRGMEFMVGRPEISSSPLSYDRGNLAEPIYALMIASGHPDHPGLGASKSRVDRSDFHRFFEANSRILRLKGLPIGSIKKVICGPLQTLSSDNFHIPILKYLIESDPNHRNFDHWRPEEVWRTLIANAGTEGQYPAGDDIGVAFSRFLFLTVVTSLFTDRDRPRMVRVLEMIASVHLKYPAEALAHIPPLEDFETFISQLENAQSLPTEINAMGTQALEFHRVIRLHDHKLVELSTGNLAMVPEEAQTGDVLVLPAGSRVPFTARLHKKLPRRVKELQGCLQLVGESYVHGAMNGELIDAAIFAKGRVPWVDMRFL